jgi:hypothetical protein
MRNADSAEKFTNQMGGEENLRTCRSNLESLQNLSYLTSLDADQPQQVRLIARMMEWHIQNLSQALSPPPQKFHDAAIDCCD